MNSAASEIPLDPASAKSSDRLWPALTVVPVVAWIGDYLFWRQIPGLALGLYFCRAALVVIVLHPRSVQRWRPWTAWGLMVLTAVATALETSLTNSVVLLVLLAVVVGESCYADVIGTAWARWSEAMVGWVCALGRWAWLFRRLASSTLVSMGLSKATGDIVTRSLQSIAPAACLGVIFLVVFQSGNAIFRQICTRFYTGVIEWLEAFDFSIEHLVFWFVLSTLILALVHPRKAASHARIWTRQWSRIPRPDHSVAVWQSRSILFVLNALFFTVNTIDVSYLWQHARLPEGVTPSQFVHSGVASLILATLLSAVVLATMFQQTVEVTRSRGLKALALLWIGQNLMLMAGVFLRLKLYVDAYQLSLLRIYVGCFLLLVTAGFVLLAWHIVFDGRLNALIFRNVLAVFLLFFVLQFLDVAGYVAQFNVAQWRNDRTRTLDSEYLESLGPGGWTALAAVAVANDRRTPDVMEVRDRVRRLARAERHPFDWRSFQIRRAKADVVLGRAAAGLGPAPGHPL
jgi:hypothetical protein